MQSCQVWQIAYIHISRYHTFENLLYICHWVASLDGRMLPC